MSKKRNNADDQKYRAGVIAALADQTWPIFRTEIEASLVRKGIADFTDAGGGKMRVNGLCGVFFQLLDDGLIELGPKEGNRLSYILTAKGRNLVK